MTYMRMYHFINITHGELPVVIEELESPKKLKRVFETEIHEYADKNPKMFINDIRVVCGKLTISVADKKEYLFWR